MLGQQDTRTNGYRQLHLRDVAMGRGRVVRPLEANLHLRSTPACRPAAISEGVKSVHTWAQTVWPTLAEPVTRRSRSDPENVPPRVTFFVFVLVRRNRDRLCSSRLHALVLAGGVHPARQRSEVGRGDPKKNTNSNSNTNTQYTCDTGNTLLARPHESRGRSFESTIHRLPNVRAW